MRWSMPDKLPPIKGVIDRFHIYDRIVNRNKAKVWASGSPVTYWRNSSITKSGKLPEGLTKCYCWQSPDGGDAQVSSPDRKHFLCAGTGYLKGYQKYGYEDIVLSTPSDFTKSSNNLVRSGNRSSAYVISGNSLEETLTSERFTLTNFQEAEFFLTNEAVDKDQNRIEYFYSTDDSAWTQLVVTDYLTSPIANKQATITLPAGTEYIRFKITLQKRQTTSQSPKWNSIRFRYRKHIFLSEMDPRFDIDMPAFLAAREQQVREITQGEHGWKTVFPLAWWTLPDADIQDADIIMFLQGTYENERYEVKNLKEFVYGNTLQILHKSFQSEYIRDENDLLGIIHYLL